jgi:hypothetical protein
MQGVRSRRRHAACTRDLTPQSETCRARVQSENSLIDSLAAVRAKAWAKRFDAMHPVVGIKPKLVKGFLLVCFEEAFLAFGKLASGVVDDLDVVGNPLERNKCSSSEAVAPNNSSA